MFAGQRQNENTRTVELSEQDISLTEKNRTTREMTSSDITDIERINRTKQQSSEDRDINTSVSQTVTTVHERRDVDESMKILENYSGEIVNNIMKCGPNINLTNARNMVNSVLVDESVNRAVDGSQAIVVVGNRNIVRNAKLNNMINLVGDTTVYDCVAKQVSDLISRKDSLLSGTKTNTGSTLTGAQLETEGSDISDKNKSGMGAQNVNEMKMDKESVLENEFGQENTTDLGQTTKQETILDLFQGAGGGGGLMILLLFIFLIIGAILFVVYKVFSTVSDTASAVGDVAASATAAATGSAPPASKEKWGLIHYVLVVGLVVGLVLGIWMLVDMLTKEPDKTEPFGIRTAQNTPPPTRAEQFVAAALALVLLLLIIYRFAGSGQPKMVGGGLGMPSFYELYLFVLTLGVVGASVAFFVWEAPA